MERDAARAGSNNISEERDPVRQALNRIGARRTSLNRNRKVPARSTRRKSASSAESVGRFWFREPSQVMIQGNFHGVEGAKAIGSSGNYTDFVVETFHGAIGDFPFRPEPIQDQRFMGPQHPGHPFDRLQF